MIDEIAVGFGIGVGLGMITGLPLGVVNVAVVATAARHGARAGGAIGVGGALADAGHAAVAFAGLAPVLAAHPTVATALTLGSAVLILVFAWHLARPRRPAALAGRGAGHRPSPRGWLRGLATGVVLTLPNPAAVTAWIAVATALGPHRSTPVALATAVGVGVGSAGYFVGLAILAARSALAVTRPRWIDQAAALALATLGVLALVRAGWRLIARG